MHQELSSVVPALRHFFAECLESPEPACSADIPVRGLTGLSSPTSHPGDRKIAETRTLPVVRPPSEARSVRRAGSASATEGGEGRRRAAAAQFRQSSAEQFEQLALRLFELQYELNVPYRRLCDARGVGPATVADWRQIPSVPTSAFKEFEFSCIETSARTTWFESSGTTQAARSRTHHSRESLQLYHAALLPWFQRHLLPESEQGEPTRGARDLAALTPPQSQAPHSSLVHMLDAVSVQPWFAHATFAGSRDVTGAWTMNTDAFMAAVQQANTSTRPMLVTGTAFNFVHLLDSTDTEKVSLPAGSRLMETGGYKGQSRELPKDRLHAELSAKFGVRAEDIVTEYGMTELGSQAYDQVAGERHAQRLLKFPPWARATVVSAETGREVAEGEEGLVRIVDLANAFSVVAVETEDLAVRHADGIELLGRRPAAEPRGCSLMTA